MNAAFLLVTTAWLAGADPAPAVAPAAPAAPTAPAASAAPAAPPTSCYRAALAVEAVVQFHLVVVAVKKASWHGCAAGCVLALAVAAVASKLAAPKPVTCSSCSCEKRLHILHSCDICAPKCEAPAKPVCCVPKPVCEPKPVCTTCSTCGGEHRLLERLRQLFHRDCDTCTTCGTTGAPKAEPIPAPKDGDRKQMPTGQKDVQIVPPGLELSPAGGAF